MEVPQSMEAVLEMNADFCCHLNAEDNISLFKEEVIGVADVSEAVVHIVYFVLLS
jgi:hypothetical protein